MAPNNPVSDLMALLRASTHFNKVVTVEEVVKESLKQPGLHFEAAAGQTPDLQGALTSASPSLEKKEETPDLYSELQAAVSFVSQSLGPLPASARRHVGSQDSRAIFSCVFNDPHDRQLVAALKAGSLAWAEAVSARRLLEAKIAYRVLAHDTLERQRLERLKPWVFNPDEDELEQIVSDTSYYLRWIQPGDAVAAERLRKYEPMLEAAIYDRVSTWARGFRAPPPNMAPAVHAPVVPTPAPVLTTPANPAPASPKRLAKTVEETSTSEPAAKRPRQWSEVDMKREKKKADVSPGTEKLERGKRPSQDFFCTR